MAKTPAKTVRKKKSAASAPSILAPASSPTSTAKKRRLKKPQYKSFQLHKHITSEGHTVPSAFRLLRAAVVMLARNWKIFAVISLLYGVLNFVLVQGFTVQSLSEVKDALSKTAQGQFSWAVNGASLLTYLLSSTTGSDNPAAGIYQVIMQIMVSLALIWALRQLYAGNKMRIRDAFYQGMYPLVPILLVLVVMVLQALPGAAGVYLYSIVTNSGIAVTVPEQILWALVAFLTILLSLYMICSSVIALYVVSLPNMTPRTALQSARQLVQFRRWAVLRKLVFLPVALLLAAVVVLAPFVLFLTPAAPWVFLVISMFALPVVHSYLYTLYRSLL